MSWLSVDDWVQRVHAVNANGDSPATTRRKRPLVSPPMSSTPRKKKRPDPTLQTNEGEGDNDALQETPRPAKRTKPVSDTSLSDAPSLHSNRSGTGDGSSRTGRSSPTKKMARLRVNATMQHRMMDSGAEDFPTSLQKFLDPIIEATTLCEGLLFESQRQEIQDYVSADPTRRRNFEACYKRETLFITTCPDPNTYARRLDPEFVGFILDEARECDEHLHPEASWNMMVHYPLMRRAIVGPTRRRDTDRSNGPTVTVVPCATASLVSDFRVQDAPAHKVDFAIALEPGGPGGSVDQIEALRESMPGWSVNHTDYTPLINRPIAVSVETKRTNDDFEKARVQLMVWLAAHWMKVESMTGCPPEVLPAIIIQGHNWYLVTSTRASDGKKFLWCKHNFGSTSTPLGIYKIAWTLRYLAKWAVDMHWSWFKECLKEKI
ncbi:hypothetical protein F4802DRAFT_377536 [Xylaria palmicola]|nr:hypothetical protein F4802DRAFT_377536 [Xylaria palmicola]